MNVSIVEGDLLDQRVDAIVNAWNRNIIPWWLLWPHGVSGAIKKRGGLQPFREIGRVGPIPLGQARLTGAGTLPFKAIIHVAGIDGLWRASEASIGDSVRNATAIVEQEGVAAVAFPIIGAGAGSFDEDRALDIMRAAFSKLNSTAQVSVVRFRPQVGRR